MNITFTSSVTGAGAWRLVRMNDNRVFFPVGGVVTFQADIAGELKVKYIISGVDGTDVRITYSCINNAGVSFSDKNPKNASPITRRIPPSGETQLTLTIPLQ